jgi:O-antigen/teichoic acid export membrane protein
MMEDLQRDLKRKALHGGLAKLFAQVANFLVRIASLMVLARLLDPQDFGLVGMVTVVTGFFNLFKDAGLSAAAVQRASVTVEQVSTLFWINLAVGIVLGALSVVIAPALVSFYDEPRLFPITVAIATGFVFNALGVQHTVLLQREMRFALLAMIEVASLVVSAAVGIGMGIAGYGLWALVAMAITPSAAQSIGVWLATKWIPRMPSRGVGIRAMMRFGGTTTLNGIVVYIAYNLEKVLLGRIWGAETLGLYGRAYQLVNMPTENLNSAIGGVTFATLSRLQGDPVRQRRYFLRGYSLVLSLTLPATAACLLFADEIILVLLGPKWAEAAPIFRFLGPTIFVFALINPLGWLLFSLGLVGRSLRIALVLAPLTIAGYLVGLPYGPKGVALGYSTILMLWVIPHIKWCIHGTNISARDIVQAVSHPSLSVVAAAGFSYAVHLLIGQMLSPLPKLSVECAVLLCSYLWMLLYVMKQKGFYLGLFQELKGLSRGDRGNVDGT